MQLTGEQRVAAPRQRVWEALNDPEVLRASIPGCQTLEKEGDDSYVATVEVKIGPIGARFKGAVKLADLDPPNGYTLSGQGNAGVAGTARGDARVRLADDGGGTLVSYTVDAEVGGRLAQLGGPIIEATAKQLAGKFFAKFDEVVTGRAKPSQTPQAAPSPSRAAPAPGAGATASTGLPMGWILAVIVGVLVGFLVGRSQGDAGSDWAGLAIGLLVIVVAAAGFEYGRRTASPTVTLDAALLRRLVEGAKE